MNFRNRKWCTFHFCLWHSWKRFFKKRKLFAFPDFLQKQCFYFEIQYFHLFTWVSGTSLKQQPAEINEKKVFLSCRDWWYVQLLVRLFSAPSDPIRSVFDPIRLDPIRFRSDPISSDPFSIRSVWIRKKRAGSDPIRTGPIRIRFGPFLANTAKNVWKLRVCKKR